MTGKGKLEKLTEGIQSFFQLIEDGNLFEVLIKVAIFIMLVMIYHTVILLILHHIVIPMLQRYFMDQLLGQLNARLIAFSWGGYSIPDLHNFKLKIRDA